MPTLFQVIHHLGPINSFDSVRLDENAEIVGAQNVHNLISLYFYYLRLQSRRLSIQELSIFFNKKKCINRLLSNGWFDFNVFFSIVLF